MKQHIYIIFIGFLLIGVGIFNMFDIDVSPSSTVVDVYELEKGRAESSHIVHIYSQSENNISVYLTLKNGPESGTLIYKLPHNTKIESDYFNAKQKSEISVHSVDSEEGLNVYVEYPGRNYVNQRLAFQASIPANIKTIMGRYLFELPAVTNIQFPVSYSFHPRGSANIDINGTHAEPSDGASVGLSWDNLAKVKENTTISVETPYLIRSSQISLVLGAMLIAIGVNLLTTHAYESIRKGH